MRVEEKDYINYELNKIMIYAELFINCNSNDDVVLSSGSCSMLGVEIMNSLKKIKTQIDNIS